jgi:nitrate reductase assembly molybdenum cofactor insertion protein NarJ
MKVVLPKINFTEVLRAMSVAYTAVLEVSEDSVLFLSSLLHAERRRRGTRKGRRALGTYKQAVLVLCWRLKRLATRM